MTTFSVYEGGMAGFSKVFSTIWGGSLYGHFEASAVFLVFLSLADRDGIVDMTPEAIAGTTGWPIAFIRKGIKELEATDDRSRTKGHEGRRILRTDEHRLWGWTITNYSLYRDKMRSADRKEYLATKQREYRARDKAYTAVDKLTTVDQYQPIAEADTEAEADKNKSRFADFWNEYPKKVSKAQAEKIWNRKGLDSHADRLIQDVIFRVANDAAWKDKTFIPHASTYLNQERWNDEVQSHEAPKRNLSAVERVSQATRARETERTTDKRIVAKDG